MATIIRSGGASPSASEITSAATAEVAVYATGGESTVTCTLTKAYAFAIATVSYWANSSSIAPSITYTGSGTTLVNNQTIQIIENANNGSGDRQKTTVIKNAASGNKFSVAGVTGVGRILLKVVGVTINEP